MNFGFDIDGTITAEPEAYAAIMASLTAAGHWCHVITGTMDDAVTDDHTAKRRAQLEKHGILPGVHWNYLHIVTAPHAINKAKYCEQRDIRMLFEDSDAYIEECRKVTRCLRMM